MNFPTVNHPPLFKNSQIREIANSSVLDMKIKSSKKHRKSQGNFLGKSGIFRVLSEFCFSSSIHGVSYFAERRLHWIEKIFWFVAFVTSSGLCVSSIYSFWAKWRENLVIVTNSPTPWPIGDIPFPAISICSLAKFSIHKFNYTGVYRSLLKLDGNQSRSVTEDDLNHMKIASQLCDEFAVADVHKSFNQNFMDGKIMSTISNLAPNFNDTVIDCMFNGVPCIQFLYPLITDEGLCYTFNGLNANEIFADDLAKDTHSLKPPPSNWRMEGGYDESANTKTYPYRVFSAEAHSSFTAVLKIFNYDIQYLCSGAQNGFKIAFHAPNEQPNLWKTFSYISPNRATFFKIKPQLIITSPNVFGYSPQTRKCFFTFERRLRYFKEYTQRNCEVECLTNVTLAGCGCVEFAMPRLKIDKICGPAKMNCSTHIGFKLFQSDNINVCNCLPACTSISYAFDATQTDYNMRELVSKSKFHQNIDHKDSSFSRIMVSLKDDEFIPQQRTESYTLIDFLAVSGGLFGLFLGASVLSFFELFYYLTVRIFFTHRQQQKPIDPKVGYPQKIFTFLP